MGRKGCEYIKKEFDRGALISTLENFLNEAVQKYKEKTIIKR
jgi:hypothetical protein